MHIWVKKLKFCRWEFREIKKGRIFFLAKEDLEKLKKKKKKKKSITHARACPLTEQDSLSGHHLPLLNEENEVT